MKIKLIAFAMLLANSLCAQNFNGALVFERDEHKGIVDTLGTVFMDPNYNFASITNDEQYVVLQNNQNKYGVLNAKLDTIFPFKYDYISEQNKLFIVSNNEKYGVLHINKKEILPIKYKNISGFSKPFLGFSYETSDGEFGIIDIKGKNILKNVKYRIEPVSTKVFLAKINDQSFFVNRKMQKINELPVQFIIPLTNEFTAVYKVDGNNYLVGLINKKGELLFEPNYKTLEYHEKLKRFIVEKNNSSVLLNEDLKTISTLDFEKIELSQQTDLFKVYQNKKYGFIDKNAKIVIPLIYDEAEMFSEGLAGVVKDGKWGFINEKGETVIDFTFIGKMESFNKGYARFYKGNFTTTGRYTSFKASFIDRKGNYVLEPFYEELYYISKNKAIGVRNGTKYLVDIKSNTEIFELRKDDRIFQISG